MNFTQIKSSFIFKAIVGLVEMSGILLDKFTKGRIILLLLIFLEIWAFRNISFLNTYEFAIYYAIIWFVVRQSFLFLSFTPNGIANWMKNKWGEVDGGELYLLITAFSFWYRARSFTIFVQHTQWDFFPSLKTYFPTLFQFMGFEVNALIIISYCFVIFGLIINTWAFVLIERGAYYYMDMFYGRFLTSFQKSGPYKVFENPMYGPGQLPSYGVALAVGSVSGLLMTLANQIFAYLFYYYLEKPHIKRVLEAQDKTIS
ncbi:MAG: phosphatidylethanolamine N-methyltransferase family protein [Chitinophagales bacterium]|jgi:hypothetical protein|nr:phosphatidylethanolamine N-methyltransferase family protein [Chitinophagales bacterium]